MLSLIHILDLRQDYLDKINFIAFTSFNAGQIEEALLKLNYNIEVSVCDEEYVSRHCREKMDKGKTVFLFYGMDSRIAVSYTHLDVYKRQVIGEVKYIDRGYEEVENKFLALGADIRRVSV